MTKRARAAISSLPFRPALQPSLGFEMFKLSSLYERAQRKVLSHALETPQRPEFHTIYVGLQGRGELVVDFTPAPIGAGQIAVVARGRVQQFVPRAGVDAWMLLFTPELLALPMLWWSTSRPALALETKEHAAVLEITEQLAVEQARRFDRHQPELLAALLRSIVVRIERAVGADPPATVVQRFFTILERDFSRTREVAHYARAAGISPRRLGELTHAELGKSSKQIIDERVILEHKRLLAHTDTSVKELAARTGFAEPTNLVKFFKHHTGQTPLEFRAAHAGRRSLPSSRRS